MSEKTASAIVSLALAAWAVVCLSCEVRWAAESAARLAVCQQRWHALDCAWRAYPADAGRRHEFYRRNKMAF